jgi:MoxR-like ATPase
VLDKVAGLTKFSEETLVIAAGNRPEDAGTLVRMIHNPLLNRFKIIRISPASIDEWAEWMNSRYEDKWDKRVYAFLTRFKDEGYFLQVPKGFYCSELPAHYGTNMHQLWKGFQQKTV